MGPVGELGGGVRFTFTDRLGGFSTAPYDSLNLGAHVGDDPDAVRRNREVLPMRLGLDPRRSVFMTQVHGNRVVVVDGPPAEPVPDCDALVTAEPGLVLVVLVADCVPVLLVDPVAGVVAAVHAGRRGVHAGIVRRTLDSMATLGARPERVSARLGPAVCGGCYEVPAPMQAEVLAAAPAARATTPAGTPGLDLRAGLAGVLAELGVPDVVLVGPCTREDPALFSYRREGATGRFAGLVWREDVPP